MQTIESLNNALYSTKPTAYRISRLVSYINSFVGLGLLIYGYGFELSPELSKAVFGWIDLVFAVFIFNFLLRLLYSFSRKAFLMRSWLETILLVLLVVHGAIHYLANENILMWIFEDLGVTDSVPMYNLSVTLYLGLLLGLELIKYTTGLSQIQLKPATTFIASFLLMIMIGTGLLMLPAMTTAPGNMAFLDALFTATSATCVTGLIVVDTATYFTFKGELVILALIQIGGIGMVSFATFFATFMRSGVGLKHSAIIRDQLSSESLFEAKGLLRKIVFITLLIEFAGFIGIFYTWGDNVEFDSLGKKIFFSIFHSVSAFCNAGFSLYSDGLYQSLVKDAYLLHIVVIGIIILGGLGFGVITDLFSPTALRERLEKPWKDWQLGTKMVLFSTLGLIVIGTLMFWVLERHNTLYGLNTLEAAITSLFQSVTTRTAGFNTVDFTQLTSPTLIFMMGLMFIGASPGSTGGGIKTITFVLIIASAIATIRGNKNVEISKRNIPSELLFKAFYVFSFAVAYNFLAIFMLAITDPDINILQLAFEQISAFATVGLSTGITATLSINSKIVIILSMFLGRVGTLTVALALSRRIGATAYRYPDGYVLVG